MNSDSKKPRPKKEPHARFLSFRAWMEAKGLKPHQIALATGLQPSTIHSPFRGVTSKYDQNTEDLIAKAYGDTVEDIFVRGHDYKVSKHTSDSSVNPNHNYDNGDTIRFLNSSKSVGSLPVREGAKGPQVRRIPIVGVVQAGAYKAVQNFEYVDESTEYVPFHDPEYARATVLAVRVEGNSFNRQYPNGTIIHYVPVVEAGVSDGDVVIAQIMNKSGQAEVTLKILMWENGAWQLNPHSTDDAHQEPIPIAMRDEAAQDGVQIIGVVIGAYQKLQRRFGRRL